MEDYFNTIVDDIQEEIFDEAREAFGEKGFQRWLNPLYRGLLKDANGQATIKGKCGDTMKIFLKFKNERVENASYITDGCGSSIICGSFTAEVALGKNPDELSEITGETVLKQIGKFPKEDQHCAFLAVETLQEALRDYMISQTKTDDS